MNSLKLQGIKSVWENQLRFSTLNKDLTEIKHNLIYKTLGINLTKEVKDLHTEN